MRKILLGLAFVFGGFMMCFAQKNVDVKYCATAEKTQEFIQSLSPQDRAVFKAQQQSYEQEIQNYVLTHQSEIENQDVEKTIKFTIPVVFHIIHEGGPENISKEQILNALDHMNKDYQELNQDVDNTIPYFKDRIANIQVEFKLAKLDPDGNCTDGITRTFSHSTSTGETKKQVQAVIAAHGIWPGDEYLNIFVAADIGGAAGFTMTPSNWVGTSMRNGIHVLASYTGTIGVADWRGAHTLSHEIGHWLNLEHTWGGSNDPGLATNCGMDDGVDDTPVTKGWKTCDKFGKSCAQQDTSTYDNVQNFMEYSYCSTMFTEGQKARMWAALNSSTGGRNHIWSSANLAATGVNLPDVLCKAQFTADDKLVCPGQDVHFTDQSYDNPTQWSWEFEGGTPATSSDQDPTVTYNEPGRYKVKLTVSDGSSSVSTTKTKYIRVLKKPASSPFVEGFENVSDLSNSDWIVDNPEGNAAFQVTTDAAYMGKKSVVLKNFGQSSGSIDAIASSPIDMSSVTSISDATMIFRLSYRKRSSSNAEKLQVLLSTDCGETWQVRYIISGSDLGTDIASNSWVPSSQEDWITVSVPTVTSAFWVKDLRVKFKFFSDGGNNLYIDNINIYDGSKSELATIENDPIHNLKVYPNPTTDVANISFNVKKGGNAKIKLMNMMGEEVLSKMVNAHSGKNLILLETHNIESGVYLLKVNMGSNQEVKRLIIH